MAEKIFLIRHANPWTPTEERYCLGGRTDWPLSDAGREQCRKMSEKFLPEIKKMKEQGKKIEIWASPLVRARQTAEYLCAEGESPLIRDGFREMDAGAWDGKAFSRIREEFPEEYAGRQNRQGMSLIPGAESDEAGLHRFRNALKEMLADTSADVIVLVAHATVIQLLRCYLESRPLADSKEFKPQYTEIVEIGTEDIKKILGCE